MKTQRINLANMKEKLSRDEMKSINAGQSAGGCVYCHPTNGPTTCWYGTVSGSVVCSRAYPGQTFTYTYKPCSACDM